MRPRWSRSVRSVRIDCPARTIWRSTGRALLVADTHNHRIAIYDVDGASGLFVGEVSGALRKPEGVDVAADGTIYVTSSLPARWRSARACP